MLASGKGDPHWALLQTPSSNMPTPKGALRSEGTEEEASAPRLPAKSRSAVLAVLGSAGCLCPLRQERFLQNELWKEAHLVLTPTRVKTENLGG